MKQPVTREKARDLGLRSLKPFGEFNYPALSTWSWEITIPQSQSETTVFVKFQEGEKIVWGNCSVIDGFPSFCQLSTEFFIERFYCLLESGDEKYCRMKYGPGSEEVLAAIRKEIGARPQASVYDQRGTRVLLTLFAGNNRQIQCELQVVGDIVVKGCGNVQGRVYQPGTTPEPVILEKAVTPTGAAPDGGQALIASFYPVLEQLKDVPHYTIHINIHPELLTFEGQIRLDYTNTETVSLPYLIFRLMPNGQGSFGNGSLEVSSVLADERAVEALFNSGANRLTGEFSCSPGDRPKNNNRNEI